MNADLHCHSNVSDGLLTPTEVARRAAANGVELLALTDHDELDGLAELRAAGLEAGLRTLDGVEVSVTWDDDTTVHLVALAIDPQRPELREGLALVRGGRDRRALQMAAELDKVGIHGSYEGAMRYVANPALIGRSHFARYIVERGLARDVRSVFETWLAKGKPGYVPHAWATLEQAMAWIGAAGGIAVIAHPGRYRVSASDLRRLFGQFKDLGGIGIEVQSGSHNESDVREMANLARQFGFRASRGSDFHGPGESRVDLGRLPDLPADLVPVWTDLI